MKNLKAIETVYHGYKFRSRLEARWAVFFDEFKLNYKYEHQGYELNKEGNYLPDFFIPKWNCYIEIKPEIPMLWDKKEEYKKCQALACDSGKPVLLLGGDPWAETDCGRYDFSYSITIFVSTPFNSINEMKTLFPCLCFKKDNGISRLLKSYYLNKKRDTSLYNFLLQKTLTTPQFFTSQFPRKPTVQNLIDLDKEYYFNKNGKSSSSWYYGITEENYEFIYKNGKLMIQDYLDARDNQNEKIISAYTKARQKRFEFEEKEEI